MRVAVMRLSRRLRQQRPADGLSAGQLAALFSLDRHGPLPAGELATVERVSAPSMTRIVASLVAEGLAERRPHPSDGRQVLVDISDGGRELVSRDKRGRDEWLSTQLAMLSAEEVTALEAALPLLERLAAS